MTGLPFSTSDMLHRALREALDSYIQTFADLGFYYVVSAMHGDLNLVVRLGEENYRFACISGYAIQMRSTDFHDDPLIPFVLRHLDEEAREMCRWN